MPGFQHTLKGVGLLCDSDCTVTLTHVAVIVRDVRGIPVITGLCKHSQPCLWRIALQPVEANLPTMPRTENRTTLEAYSAYDLPSVEALIRYFHTAGRLPSPIHMVESH